MLTESLKKVSIEEEYFGGDDFVDHDENINMENIEEEMGNKSLQEVINESSMKAKKRME